MKFENKNMDRKDFFKTCVRYMIMAGIVLYSYLQLRKRESSAAGNQVCDKNGICRGCDSLKLCGLPQALSFKSFQKKNR